ERVTSRRLVAAAVATLWGVCPLHAEPLGWYAVYGEVLSATMMLGVLWDAAGLLDSSRPIGALRLVAWGGALLIGATSFGTGLGVATAVPVAIALALPQARRWPAVGGLGAIVLATPLLFLGAFELSVWTGVATAAHVALVGAATGNLWPLPP